MDPIRVSSFIIIGSRITHLDFDSSIFIFDDKDFDKTVGYQIETKNVGTTDNARYGEVVLNIEVHLDGKEAAQDHNAVIHLTIEGGFQAPEEMNEEDFISMLQINGSAALYSIARSYLVSVTSQSFVQGNILLPLVNFFPDSTQS